MTKLNDLLLDYANPQGGYLGGADNATRQRDQAAFRRDLNALRRRTESRSRTYLFAVVVVLAVMLGLTLALASRPKALSAICAVTGITIGSLLKRLNVYWKELHRIEIILLLLGRVPERQLVDILRAIALNQQAAMPDTPSEPLTIPAGV